MPRSPSAFRCGDGVVLDLPEPALFRALHALRAPEASVLETQLAASVLSIAVKRGTRLPEWAKAMIAVIADPRRR